MQGNEVREVVRANSPNAQANQPSRQLGFVPVGSPRLQHHQDDTANVLGEAMKLGSSIAKQYFDKREAKQRVEEELAFYSGKTEKYLVDNDIGSPELQTYKALETKSAHSKWFAQELNNISIEDKKLTPSQYKEKLGAKFSDFLDNAEVIKGGQEELTASLMSSSYPKLIAAHMQASAENNLERTSKSLSDAIYNESAVGTPEDLQDMLANTDGLAPNLSPEQRAESVGAATKRSLLEGNTSLYDAIGGESGLTEMGLSQGTLSSIKSAYKTAQDINQTANASEIVQRTHSIKMGIKTGSTSLEEALDSYKDVRDDYNLSNEWHQQQVKDAVYYASKQSEDAYDINVINDPDFIREAAEIRKSAELNGLNESSSIEDARKLAEKFGMTFEQTTKLLDGVRSSGRKYENAHINEIQKAHEEAEKARELDSKARGLINSGFNNPTAFSEDEQQRAMDLIRADIAQEVHEDPAFSSTAAGMEGKDLDLEIQAEITRRYVQSIKKSPIVDKVVQRSLSSVSNVSPIDADGSTSDEHLSALHTIQEMRNGGLSERLVKEYSGASYDYLTVATDIASGSMDPKVALTTAWEQTQAPEGLKFTPKSVVSEVLETWEEDKKELVDANNPGLWAAITGSSSDARFHEVVGSEVKRAILDNPDLDSYYSQRVKLYRNMYPNANNASVKAMAKRDLSKWEYSVGTMVRPSFTTGKTLSQVMGVDKEQGSMKAHTATLVFIRDNIKTLLPETEYNSFLDDIVQWASGDVETREELNKPTQVGERITNFSPLSVISERYQAYQNNRPNMDIRILTGDSVQIQFYEDFDKEKPIAYPIVIPGKTIGNYYKQSKLTASEEANFPKR